MGKTLILKEIHNHLVSFRFLAVFALLLVIVPVTVLILTNDTIRKQDEYSQRQTDIQNYLAKYAHFNRLYAVLAPSQPPLPLQALVLGLTAVPRLDTFDNDPLPVLFPMIDLTFILAILMSLAALIFSYDAVSGEKEDGTLKLMLANGVPRAKIILAKVVGGTMILWIPFVISLALSMILLLVHPRIAWSASDWGAVGMILIGAFIYIALFFGLGVLVSSRHASSASSILTSLFLWVLFILVVPNLSPYVASLIRPSPSIVEVNRQIDKIEDADRDDMGRKLEKEMREKLAKEFPVLAGVERMNEATIKAEIDRNPGFAKAYAVFRKGREEAWHQANVIQYAKSKVLRDDLNAKDKAQTKLSVALSMISPLASLTYLCADLTSSGSRNLVHFDTIRGPWDNAYDNYMRRKMEDMRKANPTVDIWNTAADVSDMPRFVYKEESLAGRIAAILWPLVVLIVMTFGLFVAAVLSFNRTDVR